MAFIGAINAKLRQFFFTHAHLLEGRRCYIGCSGNFTIEQIISRRCERAELHSNDVSLYSSVVGRALTGAVLEAEFTAEDLRFANDYFTRGPVESVATVLLVLEMLKYQKRNNPFQERMWRHHLSAWEALFSKTCAKVAKALESIRIMEYTTVDVHDYFALDRDGVNIGFLPTGIDSIFKRLDESVSWSSPGFEPLTNDRREETIRRMTQVDFILFDDTERDLPCTATVELFGKKTVYIYSSLGLKKGVFRRRLNERVMNYDLLMPDDEIPDGAAVTVRPTEGPVVNHYRNLFLSKKIQPAQGDLCLLAFAGSKLFGFLIFQSYSLMGQVGAGSIYLLSDFVVRSTRHRKLSKLLLMSVLCREVKALLEQRSMGRVKTILTTAFTDRPVSMKYRGVFNLIKRGSGKGGPFLNYSGNFTKTSLRKVISKWKKKYKE